MSNYRELLKEYRNIGLIDDPQFNKSRKCHDWRNYIPDKVRNVWGALSNEARIMVFLVAEQLANKEDWD